MSLWTSRDGASPSQGLGRSEADVQLVLAAATEALDAGDRRRAVAIACDGLDRGLSHPTLLNLRALQAEAEGRLQDAVLDLRTASALAPDDAGLRNTLGLALSRLKRGREAIAAFTDAVALAPDFAPAWRNLGMIQITEGDVLGAWSSLSKASELVPTDAEPLGQLSVLAARRGDWAQAARLSEKALALDPFIPSATRAWAEAQMSEGRLDKARSKLETWLRHAAEMGWPRRLVQGLLGDVLERQALYAEAFAVYAEGNAETRKRHAGDHAGGDILAALNRLRIAATSLDADRWRPTGRESASPAMRHIFLMGFMRSGTTLIEQSLAVRDDVVTLEEQDALTLSIESFLGDQQGLLRLQNADEATLDRHRQDYWARVRGFGVEPAGRTFVDKVPFNGVKLPVILRLFPEALIVFSLRDPRDVVLSCFKHRFSINGYTFQFLNLESAARFYDQYMRLVQAYLWKLPLQPFVYRHEDLVVNFEAHLKKLCGALDLDWRPEMRDVGLRVREGRVSSPSAVQLRDGVNREGLQAWRRYEAQLAPILPILQPWIRQFNYEA